MMKSKSAAMFGGGLARAMELRSELVRAMGAEAEWLFGDFGGEDLWWVAGPLSTRFTVAPAPESSPGVALLEVVTECAVVHDLDLARLAVEDLNRHTTLSRWTVLNDPGPSLSVDDPRWSAPPLTPDHVEDRPSQVVVGLSVVVGDESIEFPVAALRLMVADQIAKATAVTSNGFWEPWGEPSVAYVGPDNTMRSSEDWNPVVSFFDDEVTPHRDLPAVPLTRALVEAFTLERQQQFAFSTAAWLGSFDDEGDGFTCEVPYGPGPYPFGVVGGIAAWPQLATPENYTSLVRGLTASNPWVGSGLLFVLTSGGDEPPDVMPPWWVASLLNAQNRLLHEATHPASAHGVGAWVPNPTGSGYCNAAFIPSGWQDLLTHEDLVAFFRVMLANSARLSWASRRVLEPGRDQLDRELWGLVAERPRGHLFGEPGVGGDVGARLLGVAWDYLVGSDDQYAKTFSDVPGFRYWMGPTVIDLSSRACECDEEPGSLVVIEADLGVDSMQVRQAATRVLEAGAPFGVAARDGRLSAICQLHAHRDSYRFFSEWITPQAVAIGRFSESLPDAPGRGVDLRLLDGSLREDRDEWLQDSSMLWDPQADHHKAFHPRHDALGLLHAQVLTSNPGFEAWFDDDALQVTRAHVIAVGDDEWEPVALTTSGRYITHATYGLSLRLDTPLMQSEDATPDAFAVTAAVRDRAMTLLGGFCPSGRGLLLTTLYPLVFDRSNDYPGQASFAATAIQHHNDLLSVALNSVSGLTGGIVEGDLIAEGIEHLVNTYKKRGHAAPDLDLRAVAEPNGRVAVQWVRPWPWAGTDTSPRLATPISLAASDGIGGLLWIDPDLPLSSSFRLIHAVLALSAPLDARLGSASLLAELARIPDQSAIARLYARATEYFPVVEDDEGDYLILGESDEPIAQLIIHARDDHQGWGTSLDIVARMLVPYNHGEADPRRVWPLVIGAWRDADDTSEYRISLPPLLMASMERHQLAWDVNLCLPAVIAQARAAVVHQ